MKTSVIKTSINSIALIGVLAVSHLSYAETAKAGNYKIDPAHTSVTFSVNHLGISELVGRFNTVEGSLEFAEKGVSKVEVSIETASVDTSHKKRDDHLRSPDFFNAKQFPNIKFSSSKVHYDSNGEPEKVEGKLALHGKTRSVTLVVNPVGAGSDPWGGYRAGYKATTTIKRSDYGMNFMEGGIGDEIAITLNIEAVKQ